MAVMLTDELVKTDKICDRWARERRSPRDSVKCTLHNMVLKKEGVVLEGPHEMSDESLLVDRIFLTSPRKTQAILVVWYDDGRPVPQKAKKLGISRATLYSQWKEVLSYVRGRLHGFGVDV
jgi:hypothetical protein